MHDTAFQPEKLRAKEPPAIVATDAEGKESTRRPRRRANWESASPIDHRHLGQGLSPDAAQSRHRDHGTLCAANELGKGALYHYIDSKEELLAAIHDRVMDEVMLGADRAAVAGGTPSQQLTMLGEELLDVIHRYPDHVVGSFCTSSLRSTGERATQFRQRRRRSTSGGSRPSCRTALPRANSVTCSPA